MIEFIRRSTDYPMRIDKVDEPSTYEKITKGGKKRKYGKENYSSRNSEL